MTNGEARAMLAGREMHEVFIVIHADSSGVLRVDSASEDLGREQAFAAKHGGFIVQAMAYPGDALWAQREASFG